MEAKKKAEMTAQFRSEFRAMTRDPMFPYYAAVAVARGGQTQTEAEYVGRRFAETARWSR